MTNPEITHEQLDRIGRIADKADNYLAAASLPLRNEIHIEGLKTGMREIAEMAGELYRELGGEE